MLSLLPKLEKPYEKITVSIVLYIFLCFTYLFKFETHTKNTVDGVAACKLKMVGTFSIKNIDFKNCQPGYGRFLASRKPKNHDYGAVCFISMET